MFKTILFGGYIGELTDIMQSGDSSSLSPVAILDNVAGLMTQFGSQDSQAYAKMVETANQVQSVITNVQNIATLLGNLNPSPTRQWQAYQTFWGFWTNGVPCTVQTPFSFLQSMAIESVRALQTGKSRIVGDFTVTFKQIQQTSTLMSASTNVGDPTNSATQSVFSGGSANKASGVSGSW